MLKLAIHRSAQYHFHHLVIDITRYLSVFRQLDVFTRMYVTDHRAINNDIRSVYLPLNTAFVTHSNHRAATRVGHQITLDDTVNMQAAGKMNIPANFGFGRNQRVVLDVGAFVFCAKHAGVPYKVQS